MKISIIGTGYVGLPTGACFASFGNNVTCNELSDLCESLNADIRDVSQGIGFNVDNK